MQLVVHLGYNHDGGSYRVLTQDGKIITSIHAQVNGDDAEFKQSLDKARADPTRAPSFFKEHFNLDGGVMHLRMSRGHLTELTEDGGDAADV